MEKNTNPRVVVLDREVFDRLYSYALVGHSHMRGSDPGWAKQLQRRIKRDNPALQEEAAAKRKQLRVEFLRDRAAAKVVIRKGPILWWAPRYIGGETLYRPARVIGATDDWKRVKLRFPPDQDGKAPEDYYCKPEQLSEHKPAHYQLLVGGLFKGWYAYSIPGPDF